MTKKLTIAFYLACLLLFSSLHGQSSVLDNHILENHIIEKIDVIMHTATGTICDDRVILSRLSTKKDGLFTQAEFDEDLKTLSLEYDRIEPSLDIVNDKVVITIHIWPKPTIRSIKWKGNHKIECSCLYKELAIYRNAVFDRLAFNQAFHKVKAYYISKGFFEAELDYHIDIDCETNEVDIFIDVNEGRSGKIQDIVFVNFCEREKSEVLNQMVTKKYNIFTSWLTDTGIYNEDAIQQDQLVITNYFQNLGFADAEVFIEVSEACCNRILVTITVDRGELYTFGCISFEGNEILSNELIDRLFLIRPGDPYSMETLRDTIEVLSDAYGRIGYIEAIVDFDADLVENEYKYNVKFKIEEGEEFRVGMIHVFGNVITKTSVILHETLLIPGEVFNSVKLKRTERRLSNIGYFENVNVYVVKGSDTCDLPGNYRDVYIEVEEGQTGSFNAFLGYSSVEELFGGIQITERNFNHEGFYYFRRDGALAFRGGGEFLNLTAQIGQKSRTYALSWTKPYFMDTKWAIGCDLSKATTRYVSKYYDLETVTLNLRAHYNINQFLRFGLHYRLKNGTTHVNKHLDEVEIEDDNGEKHTVHLSDIDSISEDDCDSESKKAAIQFHKETHIHGLISAVGVSLFYDSSDHPIKPTCGFKSRLLLEFAGVGGDHTFFNLGYLNTYYFPVGSRTIIKYRADFRFIQPLGSTRYETLPLDERIFLGGDFAIRGYRSYRLGPQFGDSHIPRGGISMQLFSVEMNRRIMQDVEAYIFFDAGHLSKNTWDFGRMSAAVGFGARIKVIDSIPQITLGMGYPLNPKNRSEVKRFFISVGGNF